MYGGIRGNREYGGFWASQAPPTDFELYVGGVRRTDDYRMGSLSISASILSRWVANVDMVDHAGDMSISIGSAVDIRYGGVRLFGGTVDRRRTQYPSASTGGSRIIRVIATSYDQLATRRRLNAVYTSQLAGDVVRDIITNKLSLEGVTSNDVKDGLTVQNLRFQSQKVSAALDRIADLIGYIWWIDQARGFHFIPRSAFRAPFTITEDARNYSTMVAETGRRDYRNVQWIRGGQDVGAARPRDFEGNGEQTVFSVEEPIGEVPTVEENISGGGFTTKTVGIRTFDEADTGASAADWFWSKGEPTISQNRTGTPLTSADVLRITYKPYWPMFTSVVDSDAIAERQSVEGGTGRYEDVMADREIESADLAGDLAEALLRKFARINTEIRVTTPLFGVLPGQLLTVTLPTEDLNDDFLVMDASIRDVGGLHLFTSFRAVDNEAIGGWQEFFNRLAESQRQFAIGGNEVVEEILQELEVIQVVDDVDNTATGDNRGAETADEYTIGQIDKMLVGATYTVDGTDYHYGVDVGDFPS